MTDNLAVHYTELAQRIAGPYGDVVFLGPLLGDESPFIRCHNLIGQLDERVCPFLRNGVRGNLRMTPFDWSNWSDAELTTKLTAALEKCQKPL